MSSPSLPPNSNIIFADLPKIPSLAKVHGTTMGLSFVVIFPLGAFLIRLTKSKHVVWIHAACQLLGTVLMIAGLATGIKMGKILDRLHNNGHTILGTIVVAALLVQPFLGYIHHRRYMATRKKTAWTHLHVWYGRALILLGMINGGLGLQLARGTPAYSMAGTIVYAVLAGLLGAGMLGLVVYTVARKGKGDGEGKVNSVDAVKA